MEVRKTLCFTGCLFVDFKQFLDIAVARIWLLIVNYKNTRTKCLICFKVNTKDIRTMLMTSLGVFIVNFEDISYFLLVVFYR